MTTDAADLAFSTITRIAGQGEDYAADVTRTVNLNCLAVKPVDVASSMLFGAVNVVSNAAVPLYVGAGNMVNRVQLILMNAGTMDVFIGGPMVTKLTGFPLKPGVSRELPAGQYTTIYGIVSSSAQSVRIIEIGV
jgi:hypothetical protein